MPVPPVDMSVEVAAGPEAVWAAIAEPERLREWWSYLDLDLRPGGELTERWTDSAGASQTTRGRVLAADPPESARWTWRDDGWAAETEVELTLTREGERTIVRLIHGGWDALGDGAAALRDAHEGGWGMHLGNLRAHLASD